MTQSVISRPDATEYLAYYSRYVDLVPEGDIVSILGSQIETTLGLLRGLPESKGAFRYAPDKWTIKELVGHVTDAESIFAHRALRFARHDSTPLPGFEENDYVRNGFFNDYPLADLVAGLESARGATVFLFNHLNEESSRRRGVASDAEVSVRALAYIIAGHELHHMNVLRSRYLAA